MRLSVLFENDAFIVIDKPSGLLSIPDRFGIDISVKEILRQQFGNIPDFRVSPAYQFLEV